MFNAQRFQCLRKHTGREVSPLIRLDHSRKTKHSEELYEGLTDDWSSDPPQGNGLRNLVEAHMIIKRNWLPDLVFGIGPTQSIITLKWFPHHRYRTEWGGRNHLVGLPSYLTHMAGAAMAHHISLQSRPEEVPQDFIIRLGDPQMSSPQVIMGERQYLRLVRQWAHDLVD